MQQYLLKEKYLKLATQVGDTSAEWRVYRHVASLLGRTGDLAWIRKQLTTERDRCLFYAQRDGELPDALYGTYGKYMLRKKDLYEEVVREVLICTYENRVRKVTLQEDLETQLAPSLLYLLERSSLAQARVRLRDLIRTALASSSSDPRRKKVGRKVATLYAQVLLDLGGTLQKGEQA